MFVKLSINEYENPICTKVVREMCKIFTKVVREMCKLLLKALYWPESLFNKEVMAMYRSLMEDLIAWKNSIERKPLILKGARQTGKTWLMNEFARKEYKNVVRIDFLMEPSACSLFEQDLDPHKIVRQIELRTGNVIDPSNTLILFDEIQEAPQGLVSLKYFCEQASEYHIIAAGSYMGISMRGEGVSFPVGKVDQLILYPMSFVEFVRATSGDPLADELLQANKSNLKAVEDILQAKLKEYLIVGGMPGVVNSYVLHQNLSACRRIQSQIINDYESDFGKYAPARIQERMRLVWHSLPSQLAKENKKFIYGVVRKGGRARDFEESIQWLIDYGILYKVSRVAALRFPFASYEDAQAFKIFCLDVGLLGALSNLDPAIILSDSMRLFTEFKGAITEQYVAQSLLSQNKAPVYWSSESGRAETDFAVEYKSQPYPIEVKAGENLQSKSLKIAVEKFDLSHAIRTSLSSYRDDGWLVNIPLWAIAQYEQWV